MFQKGQRVKCISNQYGVKPLTVGKTYIITDHYYDGYEQYVYVLNDKGKAEQSFYASRFVMMKEDLNEFEKLDLIQQNISEDL